MYLNINGKNYKLTEVPVTNNNTICNTAPKTISEQKTLTINIKKTSDNEFAIPTSYPADPNDPSVCQHRPEVCTPKTNFKGLTINFYDEPGPGGTEDPIVTNPRDRDPNPAQPPDNIGDHGGSGSSNHSGTGGAGGSSGPSHQAERISHDRKNIIINIFK